MPGEIAVKEPVPVRVVERVGVAMPSRSTSSTASGPASRRDWSAATDVLRDQNSQPFLTSKSKMVATQGARGGDNTSAPTEARSLTRRVAQGSAQEHLDGDIPVEVVVVGLPHFPHPALADALEESIPSEDGTGFVGRVLGGGLSETGCHG